MAASRDAIGWDIEPHLMIPGTDFKVVDKFLNDLVILVACYRGVYHGAGFGLVNIEDLPALPPKKEARDV